MIEENERDRPELDFVRVGQHTRDVARIPIPRQVEQLRKELDELTLSNQRVEAKLNEVAEYKRSQLAEIYSKRYPKSTACEKTNALEATVLSKRRPLLKELHSIQERMNQVKARLPGRGANRPDGEREDVVLLRKILAVLTRLEDRFGTQSKE